MVKKTIKKNMKLKHKKRLSKKYVKFNYKKTISKKYNKKNKTNKRTRKNRNLNGGNDHSILSGIQVLKDKAMTTDVDVKGFLENIKNRTFRLISKEKTETPITKIV
tara:strand:- start:381 stop:698 length:318 start_codon:yes stop_codon:yes gene_type:complete